MATAYRNTYLNWVERRLQIGEFNGGEFVFPTFYKYESVPLRVHLLEPNSAALGPDEFSRVDISNLALRVTINNTLDDATPLAEQQTWTQDASQNTFMGVLDLNTAGMTAYIGAAASMPAYVQIAVSETGGVWRVVYQRAITIENSVAQPTTTSPDPTKTYRTAEESDGIYLQPQMRPGIQLVAISPNELFQRVWGVDNNGTAIDQILSYP
jgi:hypothetical protein